MLEGGETNFQFQETVRIFDLTNIDYGKIELESGGLLEITENSINILLEESGDVVDFRLYDDSGLIHGVPFVEAKVAAWNAVDWKLAVNDVTDMDPDQINLETGNVDVNQFDIALVVGQTSGAKWTSYNSKQRPKSFDDAETLQTEFQKQECFYGISGDNNIDRS